MNPGPDYSAAVVNALWDLLARAERKPLWRLLSDLTPEQLVDCIDFRYLTDALTPGEALALMQARAAGRAERIAELERDGYPAYTTSAGWLGYPDDKIRRLTPWCQWTQPLGVAGWSRHLSP